MLKKIQNNKSLQQWYQQHQIDLCLLFGSAVTGKMHPNSDIDVAMYSKTNELLLKKLQLIGELEEIIRTTVDLTILHSDMSALLRYEIMIKGKPLYISDQNIYTEQMMYAIKLYDDVPFLKKWQDLSLSIRLKKLKDVTSSY